MFDDFWVFNLLFLIYFDWFCETATTLDFLYWKPKFFRFFIWFLSTGTSEHVLALGSCDFSWFSCSNMLLLNLLVQPFHWFYMLVFIMTIHVTTYIFLLESLSIWLFVSLKLCVESWLFISYLILSAKLADFLRDFLFDWTIDYSEVLSS